MLRKILLGLGALLLVGAFASSDANAQYGGGGYGGYHGGGGGYGGGYEEPHYGKPKYVKRHNNYDGDDCYKKKFRIWDDYYGGYRYEWRVVCE